MCVWQLFSFYCRITTFLIDDACVGGAADAMALVSLGMGWRYQLLVAVSADGILSDGDTSVPDTELYYEFALN